MINHRVKHKTLGTLLVLSLLSGAILSAPLASAETSGNVNVTVTIPSNCSLSATNNNLTQTINPGQYATIGTSNLKAICNDPEGFAIYAVGYTDNSYGKNVLSTTLTNDNNNYDIVSGTAVSGDTSNWAMQLAPVAGDYTPTIEGGFNAFSIVPAAYTKVVSFASNTDASIGGNFTATYAAYISSAQPAATYQGKVKFTLVHPDDRTAPENIMLDTGEVVAAKMKSLAAGVEKGPYDSTADIKAIRTADALPEGFTPTEANTVSADYSDTPVYIFFDNENDAGIMNFYTEADKIVMNPDSSYLFYNNTALEDISGLATWDSGYVENMMVLFTFDAALTDISALASWNTSRVTNMSYLFLRDINLTSLHGLEDWDTSKVENLRNAFGSNSTNYVMQLADISALADWDTSSVTNMIGVFMLNDQLSDISPLADWDVSNVINMASMFSYDSNLSSVTALSEWETGNVTNMGSLFYDDIKLTSLVGLEDWDTSKVENLGWMFNISNNKQNADITDIAPLAGWNTSSATNISGMFFNRNIPSLLPVANWEVGNVTNFKSLFNTTLNSTLTSLAGLENWDVSKGTNFTYMFQDSASLTDASAINNWDITGAPAMLEDTDGTLYSAFKSMFLRSPAHPEFSKRAGTWNNGTFLADN